MISKLFLFCCIVVIEANNEFIIDNQQCRMPYFPAFTEETNPAFYKLPYVKCFDLNILTYTSVKNNTAYLHIKNEYLNQYYSTTDIIDCCYSYVRRNGTDNEPDVGVSISSCQLFNSTIPLEQDTVKVTCFLGADKVYENVHATVTVTESVNVKMKPLLENSNKKKPLSVLFIVLDSIARLNFERTMPFSREFAIENNFTEFMGYNKIDDNTFPNFNALITGLNLKQSNYICHPHTVGGLDECPMIWYDFRKHGYATAYAEDWTSISTYNYVKKGFKEPPTDYYFKPYMEAAGSLRGPNIDTMPYCAGPESQGERIFKLARDFAVTFKNKPSFGIFWMNTFSHNYLNSPTRMDLKFKAFLQDLKTDGIFEDSMVVLLADHGARYGEIRQTVQGWYEERLPMNFISLPNWFKEEYPTKYKNLRRNSLRFTSTYDLYMTLQDVLYNSVDNYIMKESLACPSCHSLFSKIPEVRNCSHAGVPEEWCACLGKFEKNHPVLTPEVNKAALKFILDSNVLKPNTTQINKIVSSSISHHHKKSYILMIIQANDSYIYQVLLKAQSKDLKFVKVVKIIRLSKYV